MQAQFDSPPRWNRRRAASFVFPLLLVIVGGVLLLNNVGILPWAIWTTLGRLWPVILILFGVDLLVGRRNAWLGASIAGAVLIAVLAAAIWMTYSGVGLSPTPVESTPQSVTIPADAATSDQVTVQFGAGTLHVGSLPITSTSAVEATGSLPAGVQLSHRLTTQSGVDMITLNTTGSAGFWPFRDFGRNREGMNLDVMLSPNVPSTLRADVGAGQSEFDLADLPVNTFTLNNGAGQSTISFPNKVKQATADIHSGAGQVVLNIPDNVGAIIHANDGLVNVHLGSDRFAKTGSNDYQTSDYGTATNRLEVTLHVGIGEVDVN